MKMPSVSGWTKRGSSLLKKLPDGTALRIDFARALLDKKSEPVTVPTVFVRQIDRGNEHHVLSSTYRVSPDRAPQIGYYAVKPREGSPAPRGMHEQPRLIHERVFKSELSSSEAGKRLLAFYERYAGVAPKA